MTGLMRQFYTALGLYLLWCSLAWLSCGLGQTIVSRQTATVLLVGIAATNLLFFLVARSSVFHQPPPATLTVAQCVFGTTWITLYAFMSEGVGELLPVMYLSAMLFAMFRVPRKTFTDIVIFTATAYIIVSLAKVFIDHANAPGAPQILSITAFIGFSTVLLVFAQHLHTLRAQLMDRNANLQSMIKRMLRTVGHEDPRKSFNRHFIMETLAREKGRADRTNRAFSVCVIEPDRFESLIEDEGQFFAERIAQDFSKRLRGELRSMDGLTPAVGQRLFGRVTADIFVVILPCASIYDALSCAERIRAAIADQPFLEDCRITASAGIAEYRRNETIQSLLARAEAQLTVAHRCGGNCVAGMEHREDLDAEVLELPALRT